MPSQDSSDGHAFRFLDLPKEIRLMIYERIPRTVKHTILTVPAEDNLETVVRALPAEVGLQSFSGWDKIPTNDLSITFITHSTTTTILATSKQVYAEAKFIVKKCIREWVIDGGLRVITPIDTMTKMLLGEIGHELVGSTSTDDGIMEYDPRWKYKWRQLNLDVMDGISFGALAAKTVHSQFALIADFVFKANNMLAASESPNSATLNLDIVFQVPYDITASTRVSAEEYRNITTDAASFIRAVRWGIREHIHVHNAGYIPEHVRLGEVAPHCTTIYGDEDGQVGVFQDLEHSVTKEAWDGQWLQ